METGGCDANDWEGQLKRLGVTQSGLLEGVCVCVCLYHVFCGPWRERPNGGCASNKTHPLCGAVVVRRQIRQLRRQSKPSPSKYVWIQRSNIALVEGVCSLEPLFLAFSVCVCVCLSHGGSLSLSLFLRWLLAESQVPAAGLLPACMLLGLGKLGSREGGVG